jgi:hypothetical protein
MKYTRLQRCIDWLWDLPVIVYLWIAEWMSGPSGPETETNRAAAAEKATRRR